MNRAPYVRTKDFDHEDVAADFQDDWVLSFLGSVLLTVLAAVVAIAIVAVKVWL